MEKGKKKSFRDIIEERRRWYYSIDSVPCKYLNEKVKFNRHGFDHSLRDGRGHYRNERDALMRLNLLPWAPVVIRNAVSMPSTERREVNDPRNKLGKPITFFELQCVVNHKSGKKTQYTDVTVILRRIGDGVLHYYSIRYTKNGYNNIED